ncbi:MAG TPA: TetR/AcrR family transcriptional regulator [Acidimicrobiales bacterium]|nr:TetR/AcrR family transcriptional regulator [Acidimicrobiales bacterium]
MGRPREHDDDTRRALLDAAERIVEQDGPDALSVRAVADAVGLSTRAVYSTFGSKAGLLDGLAQRAYELLAASIQDLPVTDDPAADVVEAALQVFRPMAIGHPSLFRLAFLRIVPDLEIGSGTRAASAEAFDLLVERFERLAASEALGDRTPRAAAIVFNALCEGMATCELRISGLLGPRPEAAWREAFTALVGGLVPGPGTRKPSRYARRPTPS